MPVFAIFELGDGICDSHPFDIHGPRGKNTVAAFHVGIFGKGLDDAIGGTVDGDEVEQLIATGGNGNFQGRFVDETLNIRIQGVGAQHVCQIVEEQRGIETEAKETVFVVQLGFRVGTQSPSHDTFDGI